MLLHVHVVHVFSWRRTHPPYRKSQGQTNLPTILLPLPPRIQKLLTHHTYPPPQRNPSTKNPRRNPARQPVRLPAQHFLRTSLTLVSPRRFAAMEKRSTMRVAQKAREKERGRLLVLVVAVVVVIEDKQPVLHHLGCLQVSYCTIFSAAKHLA